MDRKSCILDVLYIKNLQDLDAARMRGLIVWLKYDAQLAGLSDRQDKIFHSNERMKRKCFMEEKDLLKQAKYEMTN